MLPGGTASTFCCRSRGCRSSLRLWPTSDQPNPVSLLAKLIIGINPGVSVSPRVRQTRIPRCSPQHVRTNFYICPPMYVCQLGWPASLLSVCEAGRVWGWSWRPGLTSSYNQYLTPSLNFTCNHTSTNQITGLTGTTSYDEHCYQANLSNLGLLYSWYSIYENCTSFNRYRKSFLCNLILTFSTLSMNKTSLELYFYLQTIHIRN